MIDTIIIGLLFIAALSYLLREVWKQFSHKQTGCAKGCGGGCGAIDFQKIEAEIARKEKAMQRL